MAFRGTGLPIKTDGNALAQEPRFMDGDKLGSATIWAGIARAGAQLADAAWDSMEKEQHKAKTAAVADFEVRTEQQYIEARNRFARDPEGFKAWHEGTRDGMLANVPAWQVPHARSVVERKFNSSYSSILGEKRAQDHRLQVQSFTARLTMSENDVLASAAAGTINEAAVAEYRNILQSGVSTGLMAQDEAVRRSEDLTDRATASSSVFQIKGIYQDALQRGEENPGQVAIDAADRMIRRNPSLQIKEAKREGYYHKATAEIRAMEAARRADLGELRRAASDLRQAWKTPGVVSPEQVDALSGQFMALGDRVGAVRLHGDYLRTQEVQAIVDRRLPLSEATRRVEDTVSGRRGFEAVLINRESSGNPTVVNTLGYAGLYQFGAPRLQTLGLYTPGAGENLQSWSKTARSTPGKWSGTFNIPGHENVRTLQDFLANPEAQRTAFRLHTEQMDREIAANGFDRYIGQTVQGVPITREAIHAMLHLGGVGGARGFLTGTGNAPDAYGTRVRDYAAMASQVRDVAAGRAALTQRVEQEWTTIKKQLDEGNRPPAEIVGEFIHAARVAGDPKLFDEIAGRLQQYAAEKSGVQQSREDVQGRVTELQRRGAQGQLSASEEAELRGYREALRDLGQNLEKNPVNHTIQSFPERFQTPPPIDWNNPESAAQGLQYRQQVARFAGQNYRLGTISPLDDAEVDALKARWDSATPDGRVAMLGTLARGLDGRHLAAVMQKVGVKDASMVAAAGLYGVAPDVAAGIVRGKAALDADKRFGTATPDETKSWNEELDRKMPAAGFAMGSRLDDTGAMATIRQAIKYRYADLSARAGDTEGRFKQERLDQAIRDVTGGMVRHNGQSVIAPRRGMTQQQFDDVLQSISDADLAGATTLAGQPITARYLRNNARLVAFADGRYLVQVNSSTDAPMYAATGANTEMPGMFILDLRRRGTAVAATPPTAGELVMP